MPNTAHDAPAKETGEGVTVTRHLPSSLTIFLSLSVAMALLSIITAWPSPGKWTYFWQPYPGFDFFDYRDRLWHTLHKSTFFTYPDYPWYYPAPGALAYNFFYHLCFHDNWHIGYRVFGMVVLAGLLIAAFRLSSAIHHRGVAQKTAKNLVFTTLLFSWPIYFSLQRGNLESILWLLFAVAIWLFYRQKWFWSAIILGIAAAFKIYPALCFALFLKERRWKELLVGVLAMVGVTLTGLRYISSNLAFAARGVALGIGQWTKDYATGTSAFQMTYDHSLYELVKVALPTRHNLMTGYLVVVALAMTSLFLLRIVRLPLANQVLFLVVASVLIPPASFDYTLQSLYIPWAWIVLSIISNPCRTQGWWPSIVMALFAVELAPLDFIQHEGASIGGVVKAVSLLCLLLASGLLSLEEKSQWTLSLRRITST